MNDNNDIPNPHAQVVNSIPQSKPQGFVNRVQNATSNWKQNSDFRMKICNTCPHYAAPRCKLCGCFMIAKTKIPQASCPAGKW